LRNEIAQERRENAAFVQNSERSKMIENMQRKRQGKEGDSTEKKESTRIRRHFQQKEVVSGMKPDERSSILDKVFE
jgi:ESF2/ABP1 family protein